MNDTEAAIVTACALSLVVHILIANILLKMALDQLKKINTALAALKAVGVQQEEK